MGARNFSTLNIIPVCGHVMLLEIIASASAGSLKVAGVDSCATNRK